MTYRQEERLQEAVNGSVMGPADDASVAHQTQVMNAANVHAAFDKSCECWHSIASLVSGFFAV